MRNFIPTLALAPLLTACAGAPPVTGIHESGPPAVLAFAAPWVDRTLVVEGYAPVTFFGKPYYCA